MNKNYKYAEKPLTERMARELVIEIFSGKTGIQKQEIKRAVDETHTKRGGSLSTNEIHPVSTALSILKRKGLANNPARGQWSILSNSNVHSSGPVDSDAVRTLGRGESCVYLYYYPTYRCLAEYEGKECWPCKIDSIESQDRTEMPEPPEIGLIFKTDDSENLEQTLHNVLKFRRKHIEAIPGKKWFLTSPSEVENIYKNLIG